MHQNPLWRKHNTEGSRKRERASYGSGQEGGAHSRAEPLDFPPVRPPSLNLQGVFLGGSKARTPTFKKKGGPFCINSFWRWRKTKGNKIEFGHFSSLSKTIQPHCLLGWRYAAEFLFGQFATLLVLEVMKHMRCMRQHDMNERIRRL